MSILLHVMPVSSRVFNLSQHCSYSTQCSLAPSINLFYWTLTYVGKSDYYIEQFSQHIYQNNTNPH